MTLIAKPHQPLDLMQGHQGHEHILCRSEKLRLDGDLPYGDLKLPHHEFLYAFGVQRKHFQGHHYLNILGVGVLFLAVARTWPHLSHVASFF